MSYVTVKFYHCSDDPRVLNKYLTDEVIYTCDITDNINMDNPTLLLDLDAYNLNRNYAYIQEWGKYYFLDPPDIINNNHVEIPAHIDDAMSFKNAILNSFVIAERSTSSPQPYIPDNVVADSGLIETTQIKLPEVFDTVNASNNYLIILGGR